MWGSFWSRAIRPNQCRPTRGRRWRSALRRVAALKQLPKSFVFTCSRASRTSQEAVPTACRSVSYYLGFVASRPGARGGPPKDKLPAATMRWRAQLVGRVRSASCRCAGVDFRPRDEVAYAATVILRLSLPGPMKKCFDTCSYVCRQAEWAFVNLFSGDVKRENLQRCVLWRA